jgi:hypothetical protein
MTAMLSDAARQPADARDAEAGRQSRSLLWRRIWIPKALYITLPFFYIGAGISAFLATVYISEWFWVLPHYLLFSIACLHLGVIIFRRRRRD